LEISQLYHGYHAEGQASESLRLMDEQPKSLMENLAFFCGHHTDIRGMNAQDLGIEMVSLADRLSRLREMNLFPKLE
jgi:hypothetical protein